MRGAVILLLAISPIFSRGQNSDKNYTFGSCKSWESTDLKGGPMEIVDSTGYKLSKVVFEVSITSENEITKIELLESSGLVSDSTIQKYKKMIADIKWTPPKNSQVPPLYKGRVTYCIAERKKKNE